jgi:hypothetical protein
MATFTVKHACGHTATHAFNGRPEEQRQRQNWLAKRPCQSCFQTQRAERAESVREEMDLPPLTGAESDVKWAEVIRIKAVKHNQAFYDKVTKKKSDAPRDVELNEAIVAAADETMQALRDETDASWWIENRFDVLNHLRKATIAAIEPILKREED